MRISARTRMSLSLVGVLASVLIVGRPLRFVPNRERAVMVGRQQLCETIALSGSGLLAATSDDDTAVLEAVMRGIAERNPDIETLGLRASDGEIVLQVGPHTSVWHLPTDAPSNDQFMLVPLYRHGTRWGSLEVSFTPLLGSGPMAFFNSELTRLVGITSLCCFLLYRFFLRRMLKQLDPSSTVPKRVREALDNLAEGLLIVDVHDTILLANQAFASVVGMDANRLIGRHASKLPWIQGEVHGRVVNPPWKQAIAEERPVSNVSMKLDDAHGIQRTFSVNASPLLGHEGKYRGVMISFDDVTALEKNKVELQSAKEMAENAEPR